MRIKIDMFGLGLTLFLMNKVREKRPRPRKAKHVYGGCEDESWKNGVGVDKS